LGLNLKWPAALLRVFSALRALTNGIELAQPECVNGNWSYSLYVKLLCAGFGILFVLLLLRHEYLQFRRRSIRLHEPGFRG
jgi:hypothetical protein